jgi:condensin complex subunit 1
MRSNTIVSLGDLAFRFPNELEPYTPRIYACLRDSSTKVRRHTMMCLTHLILNDMIKVKGNVCEIALCLRDEDPRIRDTARLLFHELSKRSNNPVYNLLPDIVSQLSQRENAREGFRPIMAFLLSFIKKERQNDMLVEKLLQRFEKCTCISQKADLAYCLTLLKVSEKSIKYLVENFKVYKDALFDEDVRKSFFAMVTKAKKNLKPELRQFVDEWEAQLSDMVSVGTENEELNAQAGKASARARKQVKKKSGGSFGTENTSKLPGKTPRRTRKTTTSRKSIESSSDDETQCESDAGIEKENTNAMHAKPQRRSNRRVIAESSEHD